MATAKFVWHGDRLIKKVRSTMMHRSELCAKALALKVKLNISVHGPPAASPGEFPHVDTGELMEGVRPRAVHDSQGARAEVVATAPHSMDVEFMRGSSYSYMRRTMREEQDGIKREMTRKIEKW